MIQHHFCLYCHKKLHEYYACTCEASKLKYYVTKAEPIEMTQDQIRNHIAMRKLEKDGIYALVGHIQELDDSVGLSEEIKKELNVKISSRMAFLDKSIQDHEKLLTDE